MRILHVADTHLGMRQYGLEARRRDFSDAFQQVIDAAIQDKVDAIIHAGDLFDNRLPSMEDLRDVFRQLSQLRKANIPFLGIVGNHESKRDAQWLDLFSQLGMAVHLNHEQPYDLNGIPVYGVDYISRRPNEVHPPEVDGGILVMHQLTNAKEVTPSGELAMDELYKCGARLILLGDYHEYQIWREGEVLVSYCGSTERISTAERARRGFTIFDYENLSLERHELDTRRFTYLGTQDKPLDDPVAELDAMAHLVKDSVTVIRPSQGTLTPRHLQEEGLKRGALFVIVRRPQEVIVDSDEGGLAISQLQIEQLDSAISEEIHKREFSQLVADMDQIVRDPSVVDTKVDDTITQLLEEAGV